MFKPTILKQLRQLPTNQTLSKSRSILQFSTRNCFQTSTPQDKQPSKMSTANRPKIEELLERNRKFQTALAPPYIADISKKLHSPGGPRGMVIISCSDPRVIPEQYFNFGRGEAAVIRNAGGRVSDAMRSIAALDALGNTGTLIVVHHTDCGMTHMPDSGVRKMLKERVPEKAAEIDNMTFGEILDVDESIREDLKILKESPYLSKDLNILGYSLDIHTGLLTEVKLSKGNGGERSKL